MSRMADELTHAGAQESVRHLCDKARRLFFGGRRTYVLCCLQAGEALAEARSRLLAVGMKPREAERFLQGAAFEDASDVRVIRLITCYMAVVLFGDGDLQKASRSKIKIKRLEWFSGYMKPEGNSFVAIKEGEAFARQSFANLCDTGDTPFEFHKRMPNRKYKPRSKEAVRQQRYTVGVGFAETADPRDLVDMIMAMIDRNKRPGQVRSMLLRRFGMKEAS